MPTVLRSRHLLPRIMTTKREDLRCSCSAFKGLRDGTPWQTTQARSLMAERQAYWTVSHNCSKHRGQRDGCHNSSTLVVWALHTSYNPNDSLSDLHDWGSEGLWVSTVPSSMTLRLSFLVYGCHGHNYVGCPQFTPQGLEDSNDPCRKL